MKYNDPRSPRRARIRKGELIGNLLLLLASKTPASSNTLSPAEQSTKSSVKPKYFRPPGAIDEQEFLDVCLRCRRCVDVCSTESITPLSILKGFRVAWTPAIAVDSGGYCIRCLCCTRTCPSGALQKISRDEIKIGTAFIDETKCVNWNKESSCWKCVNTCPVVNEGNIAIKMVDGRPVVQEDKCIGCAVCVIRCPEKAITIRKGLSKGVHNEGE